MTAAVLIMQTRNVTFLLNTIQQLLLNSIFCNLQQIETFNFTRWCSNTRFCYIEQSFHKNSIWRITAKAHFVLMGNGVFMCHSNWPVQISLSRAKLKNFELSAFVFPVNGDRKIILRGRGAPPTLRGPGSLPPLPSPLSTALLGGRRH